MDIAVEDRFFTALNAVTSARLGADHPCAVAAGRAAREQSPALVSDAHKALNRLDPEMRMEVLSELERWMKEDI